MTPTPDPTYLPKHLRQLLPNISTPPTKGPLTNFLHRTKVGVQASACRWCPTLEPRRKTSIVVISFGLNVKRVRVHICCLLTTRRRTQQLLLDKQHTCCCQFSILRRASSFQIPQPLSQSTMPTTCKPTLQLRHLANSQIPTISSRVCWCGKTKESPRSSKFKIIHGTLRRDPRCPDNRQPKAGTGTTRDCRAHELWGPFQPRSTRGSP